VSRLLNSAAFFGPVELPPEIARHRVLDEKTAAEFIGLSQVTLDSSSTVSLLSAARVG
jgi:hypothetical protein